MSIIEALVTALVLALGLIGLAALQVTATKSNYSAEKRSQASILANDMFERMRANRAAARAGSYDTGLDAAPRGCDRAACPATPLARRDLCQWKQRLRCSLPSGDGSIVGSAKRVTLTIRWDDRLGLAGSADLRFVYETRL